MVNWIRGVNLGGWLVLERFVTPYLFAITSCHLAGDFCTYPGQLGAANNDAPLCTREECQPILVENPITGKDDYPADEYTLMWQFAEAPLIGKQYLDRHYETFITRQDIVALARAGITHVRVPLPHWILDKSPPRPWIASSELWLYFIRLVGWCREFDIEVWPDLHTAPGSQNGFDNSGHLLQEPTCHRWDTSPQNINATLETLQRIAVAIHNDGMHDIVTGIGILNEPYMDCDMTVVRDFNNKALRLVRNVLGNATSIVIGDMFNSTRWNDGFWDSTPNTYLDSHYYHVFAETTRALSPKQHAALICRNEARAIQDCCYADAPINKKPASGISRVVSEWSAAFDTLPVVKLEEIMKSILSEGRAPDLDRNLTQARRDFLKSFCKAQMVVYEAADVGISSGWFYWNIKMEGGAFAEWDFLRGLEEGWIPELPPRNVSSEDMYGTCEDIVDRTKDDESIVHEYPDPKTTETWKGPVIDDDYVVSHGDSLNKEGQAVESKQVEDSETQTTEGNGQVSEANDEEGDADDDTAGQVTTPTKAKKKGHPFITLFVLGFFGFAIKKVFFSSDDYRRGLGYSSVHGSSSTGEAVTMAV